MNYPIIFACETHQVMCMLEASSKEHAARTFVNRTGVEGGRLYVFERTSAGEPRMYCADLVEGCTLHRMGRQQTAGFDSEAIASKLEKLQDHLTDANGAIDDARSRLDDADGSVQEASEAGELIEQVTGSLGEEAPSDF